MNTLLGPFRAWKGLCQWRPLKLKLHWLHRKSASAHETSLIQAPSGSPNRIQTLSQGRPCLFVFPFTSPDPLSAPDFSPCLLATRCIAYALAPLNAFHPLRHLGASAPPSRPGQVSFPLWDHSWFHRGLIVFPQLVPTFIILHVIPCFVFVSFTSI